MNRKHLAFLSIAALATVAACSDSTSPSGLLTDAQVIADVAQQSGDNIASSIADLLANESFASLPAPPSFDLFGSMPITVNRTRTCYAANVVQAQCNATTTDSVVLTVQQDGSFSRSNTTGHGTEQMDVTLHHAATLTISGLAGTETTRIHNGHGTGSDTTVFEGTADSVSRTRTMTSTGNDSVIGIVFTLPHQSNPYPTAGKIVRNVSGKVVLTGPNASGERSFSHRIEVDFPADAQGNVVIHINAKTCNLNLVTRAVTNCST